MQLNYFLHESQAISTYKKTRNGLEGWDYSSKLSAWLANGSLSPKQVYHALKNYEAEVEANESTLLAVF